MAIDCPTCGDPLSMHGVCGSCGYGLKRRGTGIKNRSEGGHNDGDRYARMAAEAKRQYEASVPTSADLTDQQWYNVCKFWPWVAIHCKRERFEVGPNHPLDATSHQGPLTHQVAIPRRGDDPDALEEREAIQSEA